MSNDQRKVCVVSLIGKSQFQSERNKAWKLNTLIQKNFFKSDTKLKEKFLKRFREASKNPSPDENNEADQKAEEKEQATKQSTSKSKDHNIQTYFDQKNRVIYVHLESIFDTNHIYEKMIKNLNADDQKSFFEHWEAEQLKYLKSVLLIFSISHIVIISNPSCEFDISYIRFFRLIDSLRNKLMPSLVELLKSLGLPIGKDWIYAARPCSPRVLFAFENCPPNLLIDPNSYQSLKNFQHALEDQIYNSLRKSYIITNISNNSVFAIPANQEFVYVHRANPETASVNKLLMSNQESNSKYSSNPSGSTGQFSRAGFAIGGGGSQAFSRLPSSNNNNNNYNTSNLAELDAKLFREFVFEHIRTALDDGFNDNIGRTNTLMPVFELPTYEVWHQIYDALSDFFLDDKSPKNSKLAAFYSQLKNQIDLDVQFSENRCKKLIQPALCLYQENLPAHYNRHQHQQRLEKALSLYHSNARGPMYNRYLNQLKRDCLNIWTNGRQLCEAISLTGHNCVLELHRVPPPPPPTNNDATTTSEDESVPVTETDSATTVATMATTTTTSEISEDEAYLYRRLKQECNIETRKRGRRRRAMSGSMSRSGTVSGGNAELKVRHHTSNIVTLAASDCGEFQRERNDPFDLKEANFTFYQEFSHLSDYAARHMLFSRHEFPVFKPSVLNAKPSTRDKSLARNQPSASQSTLLQPEQQQPNYVQELSANVNLSQDNNNNSNSKSPIKLDNAVSGELTSNQVDKPIGMPLEKEEDDSLKNDPLTISTEVYLNGMTHSDSPVGVLPRFSSWSLISIGKYADYNSHTGLTQPGFMPTHNYLIPWEMVISNNTMISLHDKPSSGKNHMHKSESIRQFKRSAMALANSNNVIRAFIGAEYECPCGHRFICSGPDRLVKLSNNGVVKDDAYKLINIDMPLYTACPCRNSKDSTPYMAQLMRVYVVTPPRNSESEDSYSNGSFITLSLRPRVQPNPAPCPIFWPSENDPIPLEEDSIWVLRLPYIYMGDDEKPYSRPTDFETLNSCKVLKGMFSASLNSSNM